MADQPTIEPTLQNMSPRGFSLSEVLDHDQDTPESAPTGNRFRTAHQRGLYPIVPRRLENAIEADGRLAAAKAALNEQLAASRDIPRRLLDTLLDSENADLVSPALEAAQHQLDLEQRSRAMDLLNRTDRLLNDTFSAEITRALPELLAGLRHELEQTVQQLRDAYQQAGQLDLDNPDPIVVVRASSAQKSALEAIEDATRRYLGIRDAQRAALESSSLRAPGSSPYRIGAWKTSITAGLLEVQRPSQDGAPSAGRGRREGVRATVIRDDVWLPDVEELRQAYETWAASGKSDVAAKKAAAAEREAARQRASEVSSGKPLLRDMGNWTVRNA